MTKSNLLLILFCLAIAMSCSKTSTNRSQAATNPMKLWYTQPAQIWEEALPIGNGRLGAMIYGGVGREIIQLNEESVWSGEPGNNILPGIKEQLPRIRRLIFEGKHSEAQQVANQYLPRRAWSDNNYGMMYQPVGNLEIAFPDSLGAKSYYRDLDIGQALASVQYKVKGINYHREVISSLKDDIIAVEITADVASAISCTLQINSPHQTHQVRVEDNELWLEGKSSDSENKEGKVRFAALIKPKLSGGELSSTDSSLVVTHADKLVIYLSIGTNFKSYKELSEDPIKKARRLLDAAYEKEFAQLKRAHVEAYKTYFDRVKLDLGSTDSIQNPTDIRLAQFREANDPQLVALYYQYGRYLLICSSQPGGQPANLQGIWNHRVKPPWDSKYTVNINTEMNYWPAEPTNLSEMHAPLFDLIGDISETGKESASQMYGARGWNIHHNTDIWRISGVVDGGYYGFWPMGGAWLSQHLWYHYLYTGDEDFLREKYPILKGTSLFYKDILVKEPEHGWLVVCPSMSPENAHHPKTSIAGGTTMDNQLVYDVFSNVIKASEILGLDSQYADSLRHLRKKLPPMQVGKWGQLQEWMHDWDDPGDKHRHVSHLYGLFPSNQISPFSTPELLSAARTSLLARGDASTGWSMGWKVNLWARFLDGNHAMKLISDQLSPCIQDDGTQEGGTYPNLFDAHPPFQIDGNFGCTSGITEMLLQSHDGAIHLLPALPDTWTEGRVSGLKGKGAFVVSIEWAGGKLHKSQISSERGGTCRIRSYWPLKGEGLKVAKGELDNPFFDTPQTAAPLIHSEEKAEMPSVKKVYEYDWESQAGEVLEVSSSK